MIGRFQCPIIDCADPGVLAPFYEQLLGLKRQEESLIGSRVPARAVSMLSFNVSMTTLRRIDQKGTDLSRCI
jgi:hypothetical protein